LAHANSDLVLAGVDRPDGVMFEGLCFHAQQAAEKALKAVLISEGTPVPHTHSVRALLDLLPRSLSIPPDVESAAALTDYAVTARYPGSLEPVTEDEYREALRLAATTVAWARSVLET
jgi:HEPN domain-containing protein